MDSKGNVVAVLQAINKVHRGIARRDSMVRVSGRRSFSRTDVSVLQVLASHVGVSLQTMMMNENPEEEMSLKHTIKILKEQGLAGLPESAANSIANATAYYDDDTR